MFVQFNDSKQAQQFFAKTYVLKNLAILDDNFSELFSREMRIYLVKSEEEFTRLALAKYQEEIRSVSQKVLSKRLVQQPGAQT